MKSVEIYHTRILAHQKEAASEQSLVVIQTLVSFYFLHKAIFNTLNFCSYGCVQTNIDRHTFRKTTSVNQACTWLKTHMKKFAMHLQAASR